MGEGAEVNLFEALKAEYPADHIERVPKGAAGADIIQVVKHNGKACGKIVYDSKNRKAWRDDDATKLREDQIAAKAEHAVLSTCKLPAGAQQVAVHAGVIIANPARVVTLAWICGEIVRTSSLRIVGNQRDGKTAALYAYITSDRFRQQLGSIDECIAKLRGIDAAERKDHDAVWKKRGRLIESRGYDDIRAEIERIIGTAEDSTIWIGLTA